MEEYNVNDRVAFTPAKDIPVAYGEIKKIVKPGVFGGAKYLKAIVEITKDGYYKKGKEVEIYTYQIQFKTFEAKIKCTCPCHEKEGSMMHFVPCCNNGFIDNK
jgi:hypothetical protein